MLGVQIKRVYTSPVAIKMRPDQSDIGPPIFKSLLIYLNLTILKMIKNITKALKRETILSMKSFSFKRLVNIIYKYMHCFVFCILFIYIYFK